MEKQVEMKIKQDDLSNLYETLYPKTKDGNVILDSSSQNMGNNLKEALIYLQENKMDDDHKIGDIIVGDGQPKCNGIWEEDKAMIIDSNQYPDFANFCAARYNSSSFGLNFTKDKKIEFPSYEQIIYENDTIVAVMGDKYYYGEKGSIDFLNLKEGQLPITEIKKVHLEKYWLENSLRINFLNGEWVAVQICETRDQSGGGDDYYFVIAFCSDIQKGNWVIEEPIFYDNIESTQGVRRFNPKSEIQAYNNEYGIWFGQPGYTYQFYWHQRGSSIWDTISVPDGVFYFEKLNKDLMTGSKMVYSGWRLQKKVFGYFDWATHTITNMLIVEKNREYFLMHKKDIDGNIYLISKSEYDDYYYRKYNPSLSLQQDKTSIKMFPISSQPNDAITINTFLDFGQSKNKKFYLYGNFKWQTFNRDKFYNWLCFGPDLAQSAGVEKQEVITHGRPILLYKEGKKILVEEKAEGDPYGYINGDIYKGTPEISAKHFVKIKN